MGLASKAAQAIVKKPSLDYQMVRKSKEELEKLREKYSEDTIRGMAARNELSRREMMKEHKRGEAVYTEEELAPAKFRKGGAVAKKTVSKKPKAMASGGVVKKPAVKKPVKKGK